MPGETVSAAKFERERKARKQAEKILEDKAHELYQSNISLQKLADEQEKIIAERTREYELEKNNAIKANDSKTHFLANISHELRTPLHGILSYAQMGLERVDQLSVEKHRRYYGLINTSGQRLLKLVNKLLNITHLEEGRIDKEITEFNVIDTIGVIVDEFIQDVTDKKIRIVINNQLQSDQLSADESLIGQVIGYILENALRFSPEGGKVQISCSNPEPKTFRCCLSDQGIGIEANQHQTIFEKFSVDESRESGTSLGKIGLGLTISKEIIELHNGKIWSEPVAIGAKICFDIPISNQSDV